MNWRILNIELNRKKQVGHFWEMQKNSGPETMLLVGVVSRGSPGPQSGSATPVFQAPGPCLCVFFTGSRNQAGTKQKLASAIFSCCLVPESTKVANQDAHCTNRIHESYSREHKGRGVSTPKNTLFSLISICLLLKL